MCFLLQNQRAEQFGGREGELAPMGAERWQGKGIGWRISSKNCVHMYVNEKISLIEAVSGIGGGGGKRRVEGDFKYDTFGTFGTLQDLCKCYNVPPPRTTIKAKKIIKEKSKDNLNQSLNF
jgi:hypothetical protein